MNRLSRKIIVTPIISYTLTSLYELVNVRLTLAQETNSSYATSVNLFLESTIKVEHQSEGGS